MPGKLGQWSLKADCAASAQGDAGLPTSCPFLLGRCAPSFEHPWPLLFVRLSGVGDMLAYHGVGSSQRIITCCGDTQYPWRMSGSEQVPTGLRAHGGPRSFLRLKVCPDSQQLNQTMVTWLSGHCPVPLEAQWVQGGPIHLWAGENPPISSCVQTGDSRVSESELVVPRMFPQSTSHEEGMMETGSWWDAPGRWRKGLSPDMPAAHTAPSVWAQLGSPWHFWGP